MAPPTTTRTPSPIPTGSTSPARGAAHLTFGHGPRYCIGAPLARIELQAVFSKLITRFPGMRLAVPAEQLTLDTGSLTRGLAQLLVTW